MVIALNLEQTLDRIFGQTKLFMKDTKIYIFYLLLIGVTANSCVEPFDFETISFDDALVIEATITNEFKLQEICLTRTFKFEENAPFGESNANVVITDDLLNTYLFEETIPGKYISINEFSAEPNRIGVRDASCCRLIRDDRSGGRRHAAGFVAEVNDVRAGAHRIRVIRRELAGPVPQGPRGG